MAYDIPIAPEGLELLKRGLSEAATAAETLNSQVDGLNSRLRETGHASDSLRQPRAGGSSGEVRYFTQLQQEREDRALLDRYFAGRGPGPGDADPEPERRRMDGFTRERAWWVQGGANQRLARARRGLEIAEETGDEDLIADARAELLRRERAKDRQDLLLRGGDGRDGAIWDALMSSRIGPGGQLYPLVNKLRAAGLSSPEELSDQFGLSVDQAQKMAPAIAAAAKAALPLMGAAVLGYGAFRMAEAGSERMRAGSEAYWLSGSRPDDVGRLLALGGPDAAARAVMLGDRLREGSYGANYLRSRGIIDLGGPTVDKGENYLRAIDELRRIPSDQEAIRVARDIGLERELRYRDLDDRTYGRLRESLGGMGSEAERRAEARYQAEKEMLGNRWDWLVRHGTRPLVEALNIQIGGGFAERGELALRVGLRAMGLGAAVDAYDAAGRMREPRGGGARAAPPPAIAPGGDPYLQVGSSPRFYGHTGPRANSAMPPGAAAAALHQKFEFDAINLGAAGFV